MNKIKTIAAIAFTVSASVYANVENVYSESNLTSDTCNTTVTTNSAYSCIVGSDIAEQNQFTLVGAPDGMYIQPKTGFIKWTPLDHQVNINGWQVNVLNNDQFVQQVRVVVEPGELEDPSGVYVSVSGNDDTADGTPEYPFATVSEAVRYTKRKALPLQILIRGGLYQDLGSSKGSMVRIQDRHGDPKNWNFIRPVGNEYVKIVSSRDVISLVRTTYLSIENLELDGMASGLTIDDVMPYWWADSNTVNPYKNKALSANSSEFIRYSGNIIHDFSGGAISNNYSENIVVEDNIIYRNAWWSTAGTHGISNSKTGTENSYLTPNEEKYTITGNFVFSNASLIASHVFSKGFVTVTIDEGNGIHLQNNMGTYFGRARVENNLSIYNGKAGLGINTMDNVLIRNNAFYHNGNVLRDIGVQGAEVRLQSTLLENMRLNLMQSLPGNPVIKDSENTYVNVNSNSANNAPENQGLPSSVGLYTQVFNAPEQFDFTPVEMINSNQGVPQEELDRILDKVKEYGIKVTPIPVQIDEQYLFNMQQVIFDTWPRNGTIEDSTVDYESLILKVKISDGQGGMDEVEYNYSQRCHFPLPPSNTSCE